MPVLGEIAVLGYTLEEVRVKIESQLLGEYFTKEANVFVSVKLAGLRYTVNGEVVQPGLKVEYKEKLTLLEALASAGDITMTGNRKAVSVLRQLPQGSEMHEIDLTDIKALQSPYFYVQPNDYIYVKPLKQKSWGTGKTGLESLSTVLTLLTLITTTFILLK
jgi:polysaccharide export outer membrane protein